VKKILAALTAPLLLASTLLFYRPAAVHAVSSFVPDYMYQTCVTSITVQTVIVSTTPTGGQLGVGGVTGWQVQMDTPTLQGRALYWIQNNDTQNSLWCNTNSTLLKAGGGIGNGWQIGPSTGPVSGATAPPEQNIFQLGLAASAFTGSTFGTTNGLHVYCVTDRATNASTATVVQCY
jgi:hypothetical protein